MIVRADRRLAFLAMAKFAGIGIVLGLIIGLGMTLDRQSAWLILGLPALFGLLGAATLGSVATLTWALLPGRVTYGYQDGFLVAQRGSRTRKRVSIERVAHVEFNHQVSWKDLALTGWFGWVSPVPALRVGLTQTSARWEPTNGVVEHFPALLIAGERQAEALRQLRQAIGVSADEHPHQNSP